MKKEIPIIQIVKKISVFFIHFLVSCPQISLAFPIYAQQAYETPREANGRIVCANCHLAQKPVNFEAPSTILPNSIFEALIKVPYDDKKTQILANGKKGEINVGAVVILPEGFQLAPKNLLDENLKRKTKDLYITPYSSSKENILVVGPINGKKNEEILFPLLSPDPAKNKNIHFGKYPIYVGINRGRAQVNPNGEKTNNNLITALASGKIEEIQEIEKEFLVNIRSSENNELYIQKIPKNLKLLITKNQSIQQDQPLIENPNVGGFGQIETEIILQDPLRIYSYLIFCISIILAQAMLVFKKKQFEKVQIAELDF